MPYFWQLAINPKFNNFLWVCWSLCKNNFNYVPPTWKLHNPYCHNIYLPGDGGTSPFPNAAWFWTCNSSPRLYFLNRNWYASCRTRHSSSGVNCFLLIPFLFETTGDWKMVYHILWKKNCSNDRKKTFEVRGFAKFLRSLEQWTVKGQNNFW